MASIRKPLQGVYNIVRFNCHYYVLSLVVFAVTLWLARYAPAYLQLYLYIGGFAAAGVTIISLLVSCYVYDLSGLYQFKWLNIREGGQQIVNIHAGFDETSILLS